MKLKTIKKIEISPRTVIILGIVAISLIGMIIYQSYALFKTNETHKIVDSKVGDFTTSDIKIAIYVDGDKQNTFPLRSEGKVFDRLECTNSGIAEWDVVNWELLIDKITGPTNCNVYFMSDTGTEQTVISGNVYVDYNTNMIPVAYTSSGATVKADITNVDPNYKWFDYSAKRWANAVLVVDSKRETYKNAGTATSIAEADILAYLVYVPRYRYQLFNTTNVGVPVQTINVTFENKSTIKSNGSTNGAWLTHPAFTFGTTELNGIWVGKFENSPEETGAGNSCYAISNAANCDVTNITPRIKPNKNSWRYITVSKMFITNQYFKTNPIYGINNSNIDAHMMKNMEWGAVAYLTQSQYGKNSEILINNYTLSSTNYNMLTGCSSGSTNTSATTTCTYPYPTMTVNGTGASTTGTFYGIYDMSGASWEYTMGNTVDSSGAFQPSNSGFASTWGASNTKYYDSYAYDASSYTTFSRGKLGDATRETLTTLGTNVGGWNSDYSIFPVSSIAWFIRGGAIDGTRAGVFSFNYYTGNAYNYISSRVVFAVE